MVNLFLVHPDPVEAAKQLNNKHVVKMTLETAQLLSWIVWIYVPDKAAAWNEAWKSGAPGVYSKASKGHAKHPVTLWAQKHWNNWNIVMAHGLALCAEYTKRYGKVHKAQAVIMFCRDNFVPSDGNMPTDDTDPIERSAHNPYGATLPLAQCFGKQWAHLRGETYGDRTAENSVMPAVVAYRNYYAKDKARFSVWETKLNPGKPPKWFASRVSREQNKRGKQDEPRGQKRGRTPLEPVLTI